MKIKIPHKLGFTKTTAVLILAAALAISLVVGFMFFRNHQPNISANAVQTSTTNVKFSNAEHDPKLSTNFTKYINHYYRGEQQCQLYNQRQYFRGHDLPGWMMMCY